MQPRQLKVHDDDIGLQLSGQLYRGAAVARLACDGDVVCRIEYRMQSLPHQWVVIDQQD